MQKIKRIIRLLAMINLLALVIEPNVVFAILLLIFSSTDIGIRIGEYGVRHESRAL